MKVPRNRLVAHSNFRFARDPDTSPEADNFKTIPSPAPQGAQNFRATPALPICKNAWARGRKRIERVIETLHAASTPLSSAWTRFPDCRTFFSLPCERTHRTLPATRRGIDA